VDGKLRQALNRAKRKAFNLAECRGVDFGVLYRNGQPRSKRHGIRFHVRKKLPLNELSRYSRLPKAMSNVPCDVIEASYEPHLSPTEVANPVRPGVSVGNVARQSTGTLGAYVRDIGSGRICMLSNWHVLSGSTQAVQGESISQPGPRHLGTHPARPVAQLLRWSDLSHGIDAAVAALDPAIALDQLPLGLTSRPTAAANPEVGMHLVKSGVVTGVTHGIVDGIEGSYPMDYATFGDTQRWMDGFRVIIDPDAAEDEISLAGDSGAVWINAATNQAVGLHFAGEDSVGPLAEYALAHALPRVLDSLQVTWPAG
jgi:hypothetical protein